MKEVPRCHVCGAPLGNDIVSMVVDRKFNGKSTEVCDNPDCYDIYYEEEESWQKESSNEKL